MGSSIVALPYSQSRPLVIAGRLTAPLFDGAYTWAGEITNSSPDVSLRASFLYVLSSISFAADLEPADYSAAIDPTYTESPIPSFRILQRGGQSVLPDAVPVPMFFNDLGICFPFAPKTDANRIQFSALGRITQTPALVGKASVTLSVSAILYEVSDPVWIRKFMSKTAAPPAPPGAKALPGAREVLTMSREHRAEVFG